MTDQLIRPDSFDQFSGQPQVVDPLKIAIQSAKSRDAVLDHVLLSGPPGLGKTTLARIIGGELDNSVMQLNGATMGNNPNDVAQVLTTLGRGSVLFIDEIHRIPAKVEEALYTALEDFVVDLIMPGTKDETGTMQDATVMHLNLEHFTCIGATTRPDLLTPPMRDRFGLKLQLDLYPVEDIMLVAIFGASNMGLDTQEEAAALLADHARGTPRVALKLLNLCRDVATNAGENTITTDIVYKALDLAQIAPLGLDVGDLAMMDTLVNRYEGKPVGVRTLAACMGMKNTVIESVHEPFLTRLGLVDITPKGRMATMAGIQYVGRVIQ